MFLGGPAGVYSLAPRTKLVASDGQFVSMRILLRTSHSLSTHPKCCCSPDYLWCPSSSSFALFVLFICYFSCRVACIANWAPLSRTKLSNASALSATASSSISTLLLYVCDRDPDSSAARFQNFGCRPFYSVVVFFFSNRRHSLLLVVVVFFFCLSF